MVGPFVPGVQNMEGDQGTRLQAVISGMDGHDENGCTHVKVRQNLTEGTGRGGQEARGWGLTQKDIASFVGWSPQPSAVGPVPHQPGFIIVWRL